jgi:hypothetical protein
LADELSRALNKRVTKEDVCAAIRDWSTHKQVHPINILLSRLGYDGISYHPDMWDETDNADYGAVKFPPITQEGQLAGVISHGKYCHEPSKNLRSASAYQRDIPFGNLPKDTQKDILQFFPARKIDLIPVYGMVADELIPKADPHNLKSAQEHIKGESKKKLGKEVYEKSDSKYLLLVNDRLIDGHHYLAKAIAAGVTRTLKVLDLTALRFQEKSLSNRSGGIKKKRMRLSNRVAQIAEPLIDTKMIDALAGESIRYDGITPEFGDFPALYYFTDHKPQSPSFGASFTVPLGTDLKGVLAAYITLQHKFS